MYSYRVSKYLKINYKGRAMSQEKKLLDVVREKLRIKHYSYQTEKIYIGWIKRYILFYDKKHPKEIGKEEIEAFFDECKKY